MDRIGVRELRQHASKYLARVAKGETIEVTDRGRPVARLSPVGSDPWEEMIASGRVVKATDDTPFSSEPARDFGIDASRRLGELREDER
ncbi:MAG TPA: type II toxin-antitoxin system prevent-host-death family antitoxin [Acidimicrobiales bacterium]